MTLEEIRQAANRAGDAFMLRPSQVPEPNHIWTYKAFLAASGVYNKLCREFGYSPWRLPSCPPETGVPSNATP